MQSDLAELPRVDVKQRDERRHAPSLLPVVSGKPTSSSSSRRHPAEFLDDLHKRLSGNLTHTKKASNGSSTGPQSSSSSSSPPTTSSSIPLRRVSNNQTFPAVTNRRDSKSLRPIAAYAQPTTASQRKSRHSMVAGDTAKFINPKSRKSILYLHNSASTSSIPNSSKQQQIHSDAHLIPRPPQQSSSIPANSGRRSLSPPALQQTPTVVPPVPPLPEQLMIGRHRQIPQAPTSNTHQHMPHPPSSVLPSLPPHSPHSPNSPHSPHFPHSPQLARRRVSVQDLDFSDYTVPGTSHRGHRILSHNMRRTTRQVSGVAGPRQPPPSIQPIKEPSANMPPPPPAHGFMRSFTSDGIDRLARSPPVFFERSNQGNRSVSNTPTQFSNRLTQTPVRIPYNSNSGASSPYRTQTPVKLPYNINAGSSSPYRPVNRLQRIHPLPPVDTRMTGPSSADIGSLASPSSPMSLSHSDSRGTLRSYSTNTKPWIPTSAGGGSSLANVTTNSNGPVYLGTSMPSPGAPPVAAATQRMINRNSHSTTNLRTFSGTVIPSLASPANSTNSMGGLPSTRKPASSSRVSLLSSKDQYSPVEEKTEFPNLTPVVTAEELAKVRSILKKMTTSKSDEHTSSMTKQFKTIKLGSGIGHHHSSSTAKDEVPTANEPMTPAVATKNCRLNMYEKGEILDYRRVYFCGRNDIKKISGDIRRGATGNYGFDNDKGNYHAISGDHIAYRYRIVSKLGMGSFGKVLRCIDHKTGKYVAVKIIINRKRFHMQALVEADLLKSLTGWNQQQYGGKLPILDYVDHFTFRDHLCIATELLGINLYELLKYNKFKGLQIPLVRHFSRQILEALAFLETKKIIHCDLKPENVLISDLETGSIKLIDFGSSCYEHERLYTYIQSRFYRSPEVMMGMVYDTKIDIWSFGCIIPEMVTAKPLFPGNTEMEQVALIMQLFGPPDRFFIDQCSRRKLFFDALGDPLSAVTQIAQPASRSLFKDVLKGKADETLIDFIRRLLHWDPRRRLTPEAALQHKFITSTLA